ncbi:MAG: ATP F0F1 synthase subunit B [Caulobacteraceae bacterium]
MSFLTNPQDAHFWVFLALVAFLAILWRAKVPQLVGQALDDVGKRVQAQLDEAGRLTAEAKTLLDQIHTQRVEAEAAAAEMMRAAEVEADRMRAESAKVLEEDVRRMRLVAERRIAVAEALATAQVKAAAADLATHAAETVLAGRVGKSPSDPLIDAGLAGLGAGFRQ